MRIIKQSESIGLADLQAMATPMFGNLVKAVVDIKMGVMILDMEMHTDGEQELLKNGSQQADLWGINLYPELSGDDFVEFDSMINLRPSQNNRSRGVDDINIRQQILSVVNRIIKK
ncbi:MAG: DUF5674 family protein [bacterium]